MLNAVIHQPLRLKIMAALSNVGTREALEFARLRGIVGATDGNLGAHLRTLEKAGYISVDKDFVGRRPRTRASITREGRRALIEHVGILRDIIEGATTREG